MRKADDKQLPILCSWLRLVFSLKGIWCFFPGILGIIFVYWAEANGYQALVLKKYHEQIAIGLMGVATVLFLMRAVFYRMEIDYILAVMSINFLCRELHFVGTDNAVVIIAGLCLIWALLRKNQFWTSIRQAKLFQISLTGEGEINLDTEQINFLLVPKPAHPSLNFSTKLRVSGTIMDPKVSPDKAALLTKGAELLSTLAVGPLGLLAPFVHLGALNEHPCDIQSIGQLGLQSPASK